ncbi:MAG: UDP-glucose--hexose-1-phosphate uridylyltransferase [Caulobacteraceae bacterium]
MTAQPHRRLNPLTGDWVLVSPHRIARPWNGAAGAPASVEGPAHDPACHLCAGSLRARGARNPDYEGVYVFDNDFPALLPQAADPPSEPLLRAEAERGVCRVICYGPRHNRPMSQLGQPGILAVVDVWAEQYAALAARPDIGAVTIFENRGAMMGASNPHPHGQIWATASIPTELAKEEANQRAYWEAHRRPLLADYLERELELGERVVAENDSFVVLTPFWAVWPFETLVLPRRAVPDLAQLDRAERADLAASLDDLTGRYDALFQAPFPYSMGWHQRPAKMTDAPHFVTHAHFYPPLLRSASIRKFMVGFEMLAMPQRDMTAEDAAQRLRNAR